MICKWTNISSRTDDQEVAYDLFAYRLKTDMSAFWDVCKVKGFEPFIAGKEQVELHIPCNIIIQKLVLRPWHCYSHYYLYHFLLHPSKTPEPRSYPSSPSEGIGDEGQGEEEVTSGSQRGNLLDCIQIPCNIPRLSRVKQTSRFIGFGCFGFSSLLCCFFSYLMLQNNVHQMYCAASNNCIHFRTCLKWTILW